MKKLFIMMALVIGLGALTSCGDDEPAPKHNFSSATVSQNAPTTVEIYDCVYKDGVLTFTFNITNDSEVDFNDLRIAPPGLITLGPDGQYTSITDNLGNSYTYAIVSFDGMRRSDSVVSGKLPAGGHRQCKIEVQNFSRQASSVNIDVACWTYPYNYLYRKYWNFQNVKIY